VALMISTWVFLAALLGGALFVGHRRRTHPDVDLRDHVRQGSMRLFWIHPDHDSHRH